LAPDFTLVDLDGKEVSLSDFRGKYVLINFWATWCQYCDLEMPDLDRLYKENEDLVVLAVNVQEEKGVVEDYIKKGGYTFPVVLDEEGYVSLTYLVSGYPTSYFVDKEGILLGGVPGMMTYEQMVQILENIRNN
jgi:thiol-disulfide isomerase/thioredoxin